MCVKVKKGWIAMNGLQRHNTLCTRHGFFAQLVHRHDVVQGRPQHSAVCHARFWYHSTGCHRPPGYGIGVGHAVRDRQE